MTLEEELKKKGSWNEKGKRKIQNVNCESQVQNIQNIKYIFCDLITCSGFQ